MIKAHLNISSSSILLVSGKEGELYLSKDSENPWLIYVPNIDESKVDWNDLTDNEICSIGLNVKKYGSVLKEIFGPEKINMAQFGNITRQFHIHIIARFKEDRAWPDSIIGTRPSSTLDEKKISQWVNDITQRLQSLG